MNVILQEIQIDCLGREADFLGKLIIQREDDYHLD